MSRLFQHLEYLMMYGLSWSAAVLCASGGDTCDHLDCHHRPFQVVIVHSNGVQVWRQPASSLQNLGARFDGADDPSAFVEDALYFVSGPGTKNIVKYSLALQQMSLIDLPSVFHGRRIVLTAMEDGLGFVVAEGSKLHLWSRDAASPDKDAWWIQSRVIELHNLLPVDSLSTSLDVVAMINGIGTCLVRMNDWLFVIDLMSSRVKKVYYVSGSTNIFPYTSFCMPALGAASTGEGPRAAAPSSS